MEGRGFTMLELLVSVSIVGCLAALSVPGFKRLQSRAKQAEAKVNLRALHDLEQAYYLSFDTFSASVAKIAFSPMRGNRYQYNLNGTSSQHADARTGTVATTAATADAIMIDVFKYPTAYRDLHLAPLKCGTVAAVVPGPFGSFTAAAQGNVDDDASADQWSISSISRAMSACADVGGNSPAGEAENEQDDVN